MLRLRPPARSVLALVAALGAASPAAASDGALRPGSAACLAAGQSLAFVESLQTIFAGRGAIARLVDFYVQLLGRRFVDRCVTLQHVQSLGTHNSYHREPRPTVMRTLLLVSNEFRAWQYSHLPLGDQFGTQGIRQIELDVYADPDGGLYSVRRALRLVQEPVLSPDPEMFEPGLKVLHVQDLDFETTCTTFDLCLRAVRAWSDANPRHLPIAILVELKDEEIPDPLQLGFTVPLPFDEAALDALDEEIRAVFPPSRLLTPDDVRGDHPTLEAAVLAGGWPALGDVRGRVLFLMDNGEPFRSRYRAGRPSLEGRVLFTNGVPGDADAAFVKVNDPESDPDLIPDLVARGYLVRTRADGDTVEARANDTTQRDAALASGAQWVSTDYPVADPRFSDYAVTIPGGEPSRCNPRTAPPGCRTAQLED